MRYDSGSILNNTSLRPERHAKDCEWPEGLIHVIVKGDIVVEGWSGWGCRCAAPTVHAVEEADDGVCGLSYEQGLNRFHYRARFVRAVRGEAALVAQFAHALNGSAQPAEGLL